MTQFELMPMPPSTAQALVCRTADEARTSSSHEGAASASSHPTKEFIGEAGRVTALKAVRVEWEGGKMVEVPDTEHVIPADLVLLAMGFVSPVASLLEEFGVDRDARGNARASVEAVGGYATNVAKVFAAGDVRRGQSLVWAIAKVVRQRTQSMPSDGKSEPR